MKNIRRGFTLIELLVVIAIIGILASIVLVSLNSARTKGTDARVVSDVQEMRTWLETQYNGSGYPLNGTTVACNGIANSNTTATFAACVNSPDANANALNADANTESGGHPLYISVGNNGSSYAVRGYLQATSKYFCIDSTGAANQSDSGSNASAAARCQ
ncbi:MAG: type II secretion system protein [Patescibacteria group bacterium]|nr:type II secretion system protein [Patescibacteria group bacterium]